MTSEMTDDGRKKTGRGGHNQCSQGVGQSAWPQVWTGRSALWGSQVIRCQVLGARWVGSRRQVSRCQVPGEWVWTKFPGSRTACRAIRLLGPWCELPPKLPDLTRHLWSRQADGACWRRFLHINGPAQPAHREPCTALLHNLHTGSPAQHYCTACTYRELCKRWASHTWTKLNFAHNVWAFKAEQTVFYMGGLLTMWLKLLRNRNQDILSQPDPSLY